MCLLWYIFVLLLCAPGHAPARTFQHTPNCPRWDKGGWGQHLCGLHQHYLGSRGASWGSNSASLATQSLAGSQSTALDVQALLLVVHAAAVCAMPLFLVVGGFLDTRTSGYQILTLCCKFAVQCRVAHSLHVVCSTTNCTCVFVWIHPLSHTWTHFTRATVQEKVTLA